MLKLVRNMLAVAALIAGLGACDDVAQYHDYLHDDPGGMTGLEDRIFIGVELSQTGEYAMPYGLPMLRGFRMAAEEINDSGMLGDSLIYLVYEDDESTVQGAVDATNRLIHRHKVSMIMGPAVSTQAAEAFPIAQEHGVVCFSSTSSAAGLSAIGDFIFRAAVPTDVLIPNGVRITQAELGYERAALIYDAVDVYSMSSNSEFNDALVAGGVEIVSVETFETGDTDFSAQLSRIIEADPDAIFVSALWNEMVHILEQVPSAGIPDSVSLIVPELSTAVIEQVGDAAEGAVAFSGWSDMADTPGNQAFVEKYQMRHGVVPEPWAAQSYATLYILAEAIMEAQSTEAAAVRDALANIMDLDTILGQFSFNADGDAVYDPIIMMVADGALQVFMSESDMMDDDDGMMGDPVMWAEPDN